MLGVHCGSHRDRLTAPAEALGDHKASRPLIDRPSDLALLGNFDGGRCVPRRLPQVDLQARTHALPGLLGEFGAYDAQQRSVLSQRVLNNFALLSGGFPVASLYRFSQARQLEVRVRVPRRVQDMLEPGTAGNALRVQPIRLHLHDVPIGLL